MVTVYHKICEYGQGVAAAGRADPFLVQWGPFVIFAVIILWMYWRIAYVPGGQPIGALERFADTIGKRLRALFGRRKASGIARRRHADRILPLAHLTLYLVRLFATRIVAVLLMLVLILQMLDLLGESGKILAYPGQ